MDQKIRKKELTNTLIANHYGGWIYCSSCNQTIGYLCYVTYSRIIMDYTCKCGNHGGVHIIMENAMEPLYNNSKLVIIKNRWCCPEDNAPLITILKQKLKSYDCKIVCKNCDQEYHEYLDY